MVFLFLGLLQPHTRLRLSLGMQRTKDHRETLVVAKVAGREQLVGALVYGRTLSRLKEKS